MQVTRKDASIVQVPNDAGPGSWQAVLSAPTKDRDGDTLTPDGWKQPLPARIPIDIDHEMSVRGTIGSAVPSINENGELVVDGTFASTPLAQEVRTLMAEGHIDRMSVAFMSEKTQKDGVTETTRELLNGAIVCIPSNRESAVLAVRNFKAENPTELVEKAGARNSKDDAATIQQIHDHAISLGAKCAHDDGKSSTDTAGTKSADAEAKDAESAVAADNAAGPARVAAPPAESPATPEEADDLDLRAKALHMFGHSLPPEEEV